MTLLYIIIFLMEELNMNREEMINAFMKEYDLTRKAAEERVDKAIASLNEMNEAESEEEGDEAYDVSEVICLNCKKRWIAVRPVDMMLKDIQCPRCSYIGAVIETGQQFYLDEIEDILQDITDSDEDDNDEDDNDEELSDNDEEN